MFLHFFTNKKQFVEIAQIKKCLYGKKGVGCVQSNQTKTLENSRES